MAANMPQKRKGPPSKNSSNAHTRKRMKIWDSRKILAEPPDKALNKNGDLDVAAFVKAREYEIKAMDKSMKDSHKQLSTRAFQHVPREMRRRTASHNVKKVPKRLRVRAAREIKVENTPTGAARRKKPTSHQHLRLEKAKQLKAKGKLKKAQRAAAKKTKPGETDLENMVQLAPRLPKPKRDKLVEPPKPPARFRRRQIHKSWLPTHVWHAKRAHMTEPKYPLWRFAIPLSPTNKVYRTSHRASALRGCIAWDMSYMSIIAIEGVEASILSLLRSMGVEEQVLSGRDGGKWRRGTRHWEGWLMDRDNEKRPIAPVKLVWCAQDETATTQTDGGDRQQKVRRKMLLRMHPSAFLQIWNEMLKVAKMQRPVVMLEDLRFEMGSIEIMGPGSTEALLAALHPVTQGELPAQNSTSTTEGEAALDIPAKDAWEDIDLPQRIWSKLAGLNNPSTLPVNAMLGFNIIDPRLRAPPRTTPKSSSFEANPECLQLLAEWPPDQTQMPADLFDRKKRQIAARRLASQKSINRRKGDAPMGQYPNAIPTDPEIPVLLLASRPSPHSSTQGSWTLMLPWDCVLPVWYSLMHYPLSTGGNPRFGGLLEKRQIAFEQGDLWFPGAYPGTKAGWNWELLERDKAEKERERKPPGRRIEFDSTDLGNGRKGEIGKGWACHWERLVLGKDGFEKVEAAKEAALKDAVEKDDDPKDRQKPLNEADPPPPMEPPHSIQKLPFKSLTKLYPSIPPTALLPIHIHLPIGHISRAGRIYRLPTTNPSLLAQWQTLANPSKKSTSQKRSQKPQAHPPKPQSHRDRASLPPHERSAALATSLLQPPMPADGPPKPGSPDYPLVPDETDLIGFVVYGNYHLGEGRVQAVGNVLVHRALGLDIKDCEKGTVGLEVGDGEKGRSGRVGNGGGKGGKGGGKGGKGGGKGGAKGQIKGKSKDVEAGRKHDNGCDGEAAKVPKGGLCIVRDAGQGFGRLARWEWAT